MNRRLMVAALLVTAVVSSSLPARAAETATVLGRVVDPSHAALPGATVTARNVDTGVSRSGATGVDGTYRLPALSPGRYEIVVELSSFATLRRSGVNLNVGSEVALDFKMEVASQTEEITVTGDVPVVDVNTAAVQNVISREQIDVLPSIGRDFQELARLAPGAVVTNGQGTSFTGSRGRSNSYVLDGVDNGEEISGFRRQEFSLDAVAEFQVLVNNFKAEYGRASGGVLNVLSRSGTNTLHGGGFFMYRDQGMIARDPFLAPGAPKDPFERKQFGLNLGGPLKQDRTHFFSSFEYQDRTTNSVTTRPYPAPGAPVSTVTQQFMTTNNIRFPDTSGGLRVRLVRPEYVRVAKWSTRLDHALTNHQTLTVRFNFEREEDPSGEGGTVYDLNGGTDYSRTIYGTLNHKWIHKSNHLNELYLQVGLSKLDFSVARPDLVNIFVDEFSTATAYLGGTTNYPQGRDDKVFQLLDTYTIHLPGSSRGSHVLKFGADLKLFRSDSFFDSNFRGSYFFRTVNDFLAGKPRRFTQNQGDTRLDRPVDVHAFFAQDDWQLSRSLKLNLGLRYDYENGPVNALSGVPEGSPACALTLECGQAGSGTGKDKNNFAPRFGFIYDLKGNGKTAIHGGVGLYYDQVILNVQGNARFTPPKVIGVQIENPTFPDPFRGGSITALRPNISVIDPDLITPKNLNASLGVRREITQNIGVDATFVYNRGSDHVVILEANPIRPALGGTRPNANFTRVSLYTNQGEIKYRGLLLEVRKRMSSRHSWGISYTLAKAENTSETIFTGIQDPSDIGRSFGPSDEDRRHTLAANAVVKLPWDIDLAGILEFRSERPLDVFAGGIDLNGDGITGDWPEGYSRNSRYELSAEEANRLRRLFNQQPIAEFADNPKFWNLDLTIQKSIRLGGSRRLKITGEVFNVFNHPNKSAPSSSIVSSLFGQLTAIDTARGSRPRSIQLTGQFDF